MLNKELLQALVMAETQDDRMALVEANGDLTEEDDMSSEDLEKANAEVERLNGVIKEKDQKYIDRFFGGNSDNQKKEEKKEPEKSPDEKKAESITTNDLLKEMDK